jgi:glycosyltransferase involved in cell wall biosynthesis
MKGHSVQLASRLRSFDAGDPARQRRIRILGIGLAERYLRHLRRGAERPDVWFTYHLYHKAPDWIGPLVSEQLGVPYVLAEASYAPKQAAGPWELGHRAVRDAIRRADRIFQPNAADCECVRPLIEEPERMISLAPFVETAHFRELQRSESRASVGRELDLDPSAPWLLTVAMMRDDQKLRSYRCLADALATLSDPSWRLIIAGDGPAREAVRSVFEPLGSRVRWLGVLAPERLRTLYRAADIFVWPAIKEAYGIALLEAQAAGVPVVAGSGGGVPGIVQDGLTGLLVPEGDGAAFAEAVGTLLDSPAEREAMGEAAERRAAGRHDVAQAAELLDRHLRAVTGRQP